ncbi:MAG: PEP/pyruvate-binding domain-containing protein [Patescibacteria group bacterium]
MIYLKKFSELSKNDASIAGGKGASLGEMTNAGIPVPSGFVILASTFDKFLELAGVGANIDNIFDKVNHQEINTVEQASREIQAIILNSNIPEEIELEIIAEFKKLNTKYVAVRSSATAEDSSSAAWAGQLDSYLNTNEENLLENVKKCWASLFTPRAIFYRFEKELQNQKISVAVVVQKMVDSEVSGIAFSVHPVTENYNQIIIEAGFGLGEAIVSGQITPDSYDIAKDNLKILNKNIYTQERGIYRSKDNKSNDWVNIQNRKGSSQCLSDEQILELSKLIIIIENNYGFPCDIEWAMEGGEFYIVQSRPITTLKNRSIPDRGKDNPVVLSKWCSREYSLLQIVQYCQLILENKERTEYFMDHELFFYNSKIKMIEVYHSMPELDGLFKSIGGLARDPMFVKEVIADFKQSLNELIPYFEGHKKTENISDFRLLYDLFYKFYRGNSYVWVLPLLNFLPEADRNMAMACREATEKYSSDRDAVLINNLKILFPFLGDLVRFLLPEEVFGGKIDDALKEKLEKRSLGFVYYRNELHQANEVRGFFHDHGLEIEKYDIGNNPDEIKGVVAQKGVVTGIVKLVFVAADLSKVKKGDIIISPMTRPEFLSTMKLSLAFVTDEGGITCHAAIVAREMGKPCIIGTKIATQILKDGDEIQVDADNGVVRILNRIDEHSIDIKKFKETTKDRVYIAQQGDISVALLGNICNTIQDKYVFVYDYHHVRPILTLQRGSQGICYFDLEMYRDFSRVSYSRIKKSVYDLPEYKDYQEISKIIDNEYRNFLISESIDEAKEKISHYFELAKKYLASTLFCEAVDHQIVNELVEDLEVKNVNEFIETSILPTRPSFVNHQNQLLLDDKDITWSFTNYFSAPEKDERLKLVEKKRSELIVKETEEEIEKNEKAAQVNQDLVNVLIENSSSEQKKLIEFIQVSINMRDERKEFILKLFTMLGDSLRYLAKELNISYDAISTMVDVEINKLEDPLFLATLKERSERGVVMISYNDGSKVGVIDYDFAKSIIFDESIKGDSLEGVCANKGNYIGKVRVIISEKDFHQFEDGEILVTGMTRAEYVPLMRKAGAIVTDEGGVTCHAAIISRELGKPCIINTRIATQVLKDGDEVEVDADNGVVRIIKSAK